jgi:hypothetical protein
MTSVRIVTDRATDPYRVIVLRNDFLFQHRDARRADMVSGSLTLA